MSNPEANHQGSSERGHAREDRQRDRQVRYFATLKVIAETLNNGVSMRQTLASTLPLVIELLQLHTGWLFLADEQAFFTIATHHQLPPALAFPGPAWDDVCECQRLARRDGSASG